MPTKPTSANDVSDVRPDAGTSPAISPTQLPIRGEKRIIPSPVSPSNMSEVFEGAYTSSGQTPPNQLGYAPTGRNTLVDSTDFYVTAAMKPFIDYVIVRIPHRGINASKQPDSSLPAVFRFLINPSQMTVSRTTLDGQAMTRAGWQIGVWGEDFIQINLSGKSAGQYFAFGLTDRYEEFTQSYRNLQQLQMVFENNGYWFEGEQAAEGPLAADFARRRIKMHQDVELIVGNYTWFGMFDSLSISQTADSPYTMNFTLSFIAWKERFRTGSPYQNLIPNNVERGHSYSSWQPTSLQAQNGITYAVGNLPTLLPPTQPVPAPDLTPQPPISTAANAADQSASLPTGIDPTAVDYTPMTNVLNKDLPQYQNFWNGGK